MELYKYEAAYHTVVVEEERVEHVDGLGYGESTQLQLALSSAELLSALYSMTLLDNHSPLTSDHLEPPSTA